MKALIDMIWTMGAHELVVTSFMWLLVGYFVWNIHQELSLWRAIRHMRNSRTLRG